MGFELMVVVFLAVIAELLVEQQADRKKDKK